MFLAIGKIYSIKTNDLYEIWYELAPDTVTHFYQCNCIYKLFLNLYNGYYISVLFIAECTSDNEAVIRCHQGGVNNGFD
jgi:hypothetical protein